ncbi:DUF3150 domain-containing protein [Neiella marina]|uniref:DUF3150 domain-containing protein n=1 Tax=Neiella holothuriorum TaxID=2870530 RepID=A0ABS7EG14_9GAMM|nr:DUF3150 domain-containing protein [Neiella holothuriorum]MBW8191277.1 DUF3150 domain-containing protein [Neiella holothuriorum]
MTESMSQTLASDTADKNIKAILDKNDCLKSKCVVIGAFKIEGPCGKTTLPESQVKVAGEDITNDNVTGGELTWFPSKFEDTNSLGVRKNKGTRISSRYNTTVSRAIKKYGVDLGGYSIVATELLPMLTKDLEKAEQSFWADVDELDANYDQIIESHKAANPDISELIEQHKLTRDQYRGRFVFRRPKPLSMTPFFEEDAIELQQDATQALYDEIAADASDTYRRSFATYSRKDQSVRAHFRRMMNKLVSLAFLDEGVMRVVQTIESVIDSLPTSGWIEGGDFNNLARWTLVMADAEKLKLHANGDEQFNLPEDDEAELDDEVDTGISSFGSIEPSEPAPVQPTAQLNAQPAPVVNTPTQPVATPESHASITTTEVPVEVVDDDEADALELSFGGW